MVQSSRPKFSTLLLMLVMTLLPLLAEAFIHNPGMYGNNYGSYTTSSYTPKPVKTQKEKLRNPWLWVSIAAFGACMYFCLKISFQGRWR